MWTCSPIKYNDGDTDAVAGEAAGWAEAVGTPLSLTLPCTQGSVQRATTLASLVLAFASVSRKGLDLSIGTDASGQGVRSTAATPGLGGN